jgi:hypothetical protein
MLAACQITFASKTWRRYYDKWIKTRYEVVDLRDGRVLALHRKTPARHAIITFEQSSCKPLFSPGGTKALARNLLDAQAMDDNMEHFRKLNGYATTKNKHGKAAVHRLVTAKHGVKGHHGLAQQRADLTSHLFPAHDSGYPSLSRHNQARVDAVAASAVCYPNTVHELEQDRPFLLRVASNKPEVLKLLRGPFLKEKAGRQLQSMHTGMNLNFPSTSDIHVSLIPMLSDLRNLSRQTRPRAV